MIFPVEGHAKQGHSQQQGFSREWDDAFRASRSMSQWPWSDVVSLCSRHLPRGAQPLRVLELGPGIGANIPFFESLGACYHAVEGSPAMTERLWERFPALRDRVVAGDFTKSIPFAGPFDIILDRASLTHNTTESIRAGLGLVRERLSAEGRFIGIDWFSTAHGDFPFGIPAGDLYTRKDFPSRQFQGVGRVHFSDEGHLRDLFREFALLSLEHKRSERVQPVGVATMAAWNLVAGLP